MPGVGRSWDFTIGPDVFSRALLPGHAIVSTGSAAAPPWTWARSFPAYKHAACHLEGAYHASSGKTGPHVSAKGWHDAGDYGRYVVNSGITTGTLLWTWELFGDRLKQVKLNIPESGNGTPDILNEIRWNLDWMLSMQDDDGGVWHKQTSEHFCDFVMPEKDTLISYVIGTGKEPYKSSCATGDFAAVMAIAARAYRPFDAAYAREVPARGAPGLDVAREESRRALPQSSRHIDRRIWRRRLRATSILGRRRAVAHHRRRSVFEHYFLDHYSAFRKTIRPTGRPTWAQCGAAGAVDLCARSR